MKDIRRSHARATAYALIGALLLGFPAAAEQRVTPARVPFVEGLTTVRAVSERRGDYETLRVIDAITAESYRITASGEVPSDDGRGMMEVSVVRTVRAADQRGARRMRTWFHTGDALQYTGTVPGFSAAVVTDLRNTGAAEITFLDVGAMFGMSVVRRELSGTISRVKGGTTSLPMLVNGRRTQLPVIHAQGRLSDGADSVPFEFHVLDVPQNPIVVRSRGAGASSNLVRIEYPEPKTAVGSLERTLATNRSTDVYGIYFSFASAVIRPQSARVLQEIAATLAAHPDWTLRIDGHTDGVGGEAANLDLSRRRAAAVKDALVKQHGIAAGRLATGGLGESRPKAGNDTAEGRALNRRVELTRP
ncbi:MAG: OmpA family protein [Lysobacter sp.]|nr:OmpA family protein [Lysobacter sp.]